MSTDVVASWKAYVTAWDRGGYGDECALLLQRGLGETVNAHFLESAEREFATAHLPRLKALLENHGAANISRTLSMAAEKVGAAGDETNEWSWVDEAVPRGVAELAAAKLRVAELSDARDRAHHDLGALAKSPTKR